MNIPTTFLNAVNRQGWNNESQVIVLLQIIDDFRRIGLFTTEDFQIAIDNQIERENNE